LSEAEISVLKQQGCCADDWSHIEVSEAFNPEFVQRTSFSGAIRLGCFDKCFTLPGGLKRHSGIYDATLFNVTVGDNCCISTIREYIANYDIADETIIYNVGSIIMEGRSSFGNGVKVSVLNETGGREVMMHDKLSAHEAYIIALYRHRPEFISRMNAIISAYTESVSSDRGYIGHGVTISGVADIRNVRIGDAASIKGSSLLVNGTINSSADAPVTIGQSVICEDFIISEGSSVTDGAMLTRCFVGQACIFGHGYSASDSLFFSNCQGENGEACAIFAGPYTVTHHKSTLLIAGMFSFMNAGSGSNQSNHMYKLGPIHQGTLERGAKTSSDSYILWPARVGAFSLVMGRHVTHSDTSNLPFSYLIEKGETSYLAPGVNLRSVGTIRDARKWPKRDGRTCAEKHDFINYNLLSPFTIQKMIKGLQTLENLKYASGELSDVYSFQSVKITNSSLKRGMDLYRIAIDKFMGNSLISRLQEEDGSFSKLSESQLQARLRPSTPIGSGEWVDISGLIAPKTEIAALMNSIERGDISSLEEIRAAFKTMADNYYEYEWTWAFQHIQQLYGINPSKMTKEDAVRLIGIWKDAVIKLDNMVYDDARKEFNLASKTGFGADGDKFQKESDFEQVRGDFESNTFVRSVLDHIKAKTELGEKAVNSLI
ncbi:MAG: DUF4954 family protein, partial [Bacteroidales bacterium]|nr:DUF4954 family protein [Bacteroidales bacterium]